MDATEIEIHSLVTTRSEDVPFRCDRRLLEEAVRRKCSGRVHCFQARDAFANEARSGSESSRGRVPCGVGRPGVGATSTSSTVPHAACRPDATMTRRPMNAASTDVLVILSDEYTRRMFALREPVVKSPYLVALAERGTRFSERVPWDSHLRALAGSSPRAAGLTRSTTWRTRRPMSRPRRRAGPIV